MVTLSMIAIRSSNAMNADFIALMVNRSRSLENLAKLCALSAQDVGP
jgi:hypothetical protein